MRFFYRLLLLLLALVAFSCARIEKGPKPKGPLDINNLRVINVNQSDVPWSSEMVDSCIACQDGGNSIAYPGGALAIFGDTYLGKRRTYGALLFSGGVSNCVMRIEKDGESVNYSFLTESADGSSESMAAEFISATPEEAKEDISIWPAGGIYANDRFFLFTERVKLGKKDAAFEAKNQVGMARSTTSWEKWERIKLSKPFPFATAPHAVLDGNDGFIYCFYSEKKDGPGAIKIARVALAKIADPAAYEIMGQPAAEGIPGPVSVAWSEELKGYVMIHTGVMPQEGRMIYMRTSRSIAGPYGNPKPVATLIPRSVPASGDGKIYSAFLHPELFKENGRIIALTFCQKEPNAVPSLVEFELSSDFN